MLVKRLVCLTVRGASDWVTVSDYCLLDSLGVVFVALRTLKPSKKKEKKRKRKTLKK